MASSSIFHRLPAGQGLAAIVAIVLSFATAGPAEAAPVVGDPHAGLVTDSIPKWVAGRRVPRSYLVSSQFRPEQVPEARWRALVESSATRWGLVSLGSTDHAVEYADGENQVGFSYGLERGVLGETVTAFLRRYRRVRVCRRVRRGARRMRRCRHRRRVVRRTVIDRDVALNANIPWAPGPAYPSSSQVDLQSTVIHELGHLAGNEHAPFCRNTPMVPGLLPAEWWRSERDYHWIDCDSTATARAARLHRRLLRERKVYVDVP